MPGPALHHLIVDRLKADISTNKGLGNLNVDYAKLQQLLDNPKNLPYLFFGCQGPDFLFFNTKDMDEDLAKFVEMYFEVYDFIENFKEKLLSIVPQPVLDALAAFDEAKNEVIEDSGLLSELQETFAEISRIIDSFLPLITEMLKKFVSEFNLFELIDHPYRDGAIQGDWWWFDALHYRKTGKFVKGLLDATGNDLTKPLHLYALGYLTHYTADTVGHPYVNLISGGPYRSHAQRHKTAENYQDVFNLFNERSVDFNHSALHWLYNFNFNDQPIQPIEKFKNKRDHPNLNTNLPKKLSNLIADTIKKIYEEDGEDYGADVTSDDINNAYRLYYKWLKSATDTGTLPKPVPYSFSRELREVYDKAMDKLDRIGDFLEDAVDEAGVWGILSIFLILAALIAAAARAAAAIAEAVAGAIAKLGTATIRAAACLIYEHLFNAFQNFRLAVSLNGLAFPMMQHLTDPRLIQFANPSNNDPTGVNANKIRPLLPLLRFQPKAIFNPFQNEQHLIYPITKDEKKTVRGVLNSYLNQPATHYAFGGIRFFPEDILDRLEDIVNNANVKDEEELRLILDRGAGSLGNALILTLKSYERWKEGKKLLDFNLDGDRGYAYPCWTQVQKNGDEDTPDFPKELDTTNPISLHFIKQF